MPPSTKRGPRGLWKQDLVADLVDIHCSYHICLVRSEDGGRVFSHSAYSSLMTMTNYPKFSMNSEATGEDKTHPP